MIAQVTDAVASLKSDAATCAAALASATATLATQARQRAEGLVDTAVRAGRIASKDTDTRGFWVDALIRDETKTVKALDALAINPVLARLTHGGDGDGKDTQANISAQQEQKLAAVRAANPAADFATAYAKAKAENSSLFV